MNDLNREIIINGISGDEAEIRLIIKNKKKNEITSKKRNVLKFLLVISVAFNVIMFVILHKSNLPVAVSTFIANWAICGALIDFSNYPAGKEKNMATGILKIIPLFFSGLFYLLTESGFM